MQTGPQVLRTAVFPVLSLGEYMASRQLYGLKVGLLDGCKIWMDLSVEDTFAVYDPKKSEIIASGPRCSLGAGFPRRPKEFMCTLRRSLVCLEFVQNTLSVMGLDCKRLFSLKLGHRPGRDSHALLVLPKTHELILLYSSDRTINYLQISLRKRKIIRRFTGAIPNMFLNNGDLAQQPGPRPAIAESASQLTLLQVSGSKVVFYLKQILTHLETSTYLLSLDTNTGKLKSLENPLHNQQSLFLQPSLNFGGLFSSHRVPIVRTNARLATNCSKFAAEALQIWKVDENGAVVVGSIASRQMDDLVDSHQLEYTWTQKLVSKYTMVSEIDGSAAFIRAIVPSKSERARLMTADVAQSATVDECQWFEVIRTEFFPQNAEPTRKVLLATRIETYGTPSAPKQEKHPAELSLLRHTTLDRDALHKLLTSESDAALQPHLFGRSLIVLSALHKSAGSGMTALHSGVVDSEDEDDPCDEDADLLPNLPRNSVIVLNAASTTAFQTYWGYSSLYRPFRERVHGFEVTHSTVFAYSLARGFCFLNF